MVERHWLLAFKSSHASSQWRSENRVPRDLVAGQTDGDQNNRTDKPLSLARARTHTHTQRTADPHCVVDPVEPAEPDGTGLQCVGWTLDLSTGMTKHYRFTTEFATKLAS